MSVLLLFGHTWGEESNFNLRRLFTVVISVQHKGCNIIVNKTSLYLKLNIYLFIIKQS